MSGPNTSNQITPPLQGSSCGRRRKQTFTLNDDELLTWESLARRAGFLYKQGKWQGQPNVTACLKTIGLKRDHL